MAGKTVTVIPATINRETGQLKTTLQKRRVAAYARVSTDDAEQLSSYQAQMDYYETKIKNNPEWVFAGVYTDEGISGTNTKHREGFNRMIADALAGNIDLILTKSVSRFARNTVDSLVSIRELKAHNVEVYFEKENIYTFDGKGEVLLTIMASLAQEESRSISENVTWGRRKRFSDGKMSLAYSGFLGYERGENGEMVINPEQAKTVRLIYRLFLDGYTYNSICKYLESQGIKTPRGKDNWSQTTVVSILTNEKYKGDALLQKSYTVDYLQKKVKKNEGEVPQYYVKDNHPAIIDKDDWDLVQAELARRRSLINSYTQNCIITTKLVCGNCGGSYGKKTWHSTDKYRTEILRCNNKYTNHTGCKTPHLTEEKVKQRFIPALNEMLSAYDSIKNSVSEQIRFISDSTAMERALADIEAEIDIQIRAIEDCVNQNARTAQDQEEYKRRYTILEEKYNRLVEKKNTINQKLSTRKARNIELQRFDENLQSVPQFITEWDDSLWTRLLEKAVVRLDGKIEFHFKNGMVVEN